MVENLERGVLGCLVEADGQKLLIVESVGIWEFDGVTGHHLHSLHLLLHVVSLGLSPLPSALLGGLCLGLGALLHVWVVVSG